MLDPCPSSPNCVSSLATETSQRVDPFVLFGAADEALQRLASVIRSLPRTSIEEQSESYLHAVFVTPICRFCDDVEFMVDRGADPPIIHVRSASRLGYSDLGANRKRVENLRELYEQASAPS